VAFEIYLFRASLLSGSSSPYGGSRGGASSMTDSDLLHQQQQIMRGLLPWLISLILLFGTLVSF
jgi:hypothetical protein